MQKRALIVMSLSLTLLPTCKDEGSSTDDGDAGTSDTASLPDGLAPTTTQDVLSSAGACAVQLYRQFSVEASALKATLDAWAAAPLDPAARANAQQAWRQANVTWQQLEVFQFGPAALSSFAGGMDLRDPIYSWPVVDRCKVETALARDLYGNPALLASNLAFRGLDALETLLFSSDTTNACAATDILTQTAWAMLDANALNQRRSAYAQILGTELAAKAAALVNAWEPTGGNFLAKMQMPSDPPFGSAQMALNAVSDALFYVESELKDMKLGPPLGLTECTSCTTPYEAMWAQASKTNAINNLLGFQRLFSGCALDGMGQGFYQLLWSRGAGALATDMNQALTLAQQALAALQSPDLAGAITNERAQVAAVHAHLTTLARLMKAQFVTVLNLNLPMNVATDND